SLHGLAKLQHFSQQLDTFSKMGFPTPLGATAIIAESICSILLIIGLATRPAALLLASTMAVAFVKVHGLALKGEHSRELAFIYLAGFVAILLGGPGKFSVDATTLK